MRVHSVQAVDGRVRDATVDAATLGVLLVAGRDETVVQYGLIRGVWRLLPADATRWRAWHGRLTDDHGSSIVERHAWRFGQPLVDASVGHELRPSIRLMRAKIFLTYWRGHRLGFDHHDACRPIQPCVAGALFGDVHRLADGIERIVGVQWQDELDGCLHHVHQYGGAAGNAPLQCGCPIRQGGGIDAVLTEAHGDPELHAVFLSIHLGRPSWSTGRPMSTVAPSGCRSTWTTHTAIST